jgi:hypothetical protein
MDNDDLVPKRAFRQNCRDVADGKIDIWKISRNVRREDTQAVRVERRFRAAFDPHDGPDIRIAAVFDCGAGVAGSNPVIPTKFKNP